jgi:hypothetical protein
MGIERIVPAALALLLAAAWLLAARIPRAARALIGLSLLVASVFLVHRWTVTGHPPVFGTYEMDLAETVALLATSLVVFRGPRPEMLGWSCAVGLVTMAHTFALDPRPVPLTISEVSLWIDLHAGAAWLAWAWLFPALFLAFRRDDDSQGRALRMLGYGFIAQTVMGMTGAYYGSLLWATAWSWDPVQSLGLLSWLLFGSAIHLRLFFAASLRRQRWFLVFCMAAFVLSAKIVMFLPAGQTFHIFELGTLTGGGP